MFQQLQWNLSQADEMSVSTRALRKPVVFWTHEHLSRTFWPYLCEFTYKLRFVYSKKENQINVVFCCRKHLLSSITTPKTARGELSVGKIQREFFYCKYLLCVKLQGDTSSQLMLQKCAFFCWCFGSSKVLSFSFVRLLFWYFSDVTFQIYYVSHFFVVSPWHPASVNSLLHLCYNILSIFTLAGVRTLSIMMLQVYFHIVSFIPIFLELFSQGDLLVRLRLSFCLYFRNFLFAIECNKKLLNYIN